MERRWREVVGSEFLDDMSGDGTDRAPTKPMLCNNGGLLRVESEGQSPDIGELARLRCGVDFKLLGGYVGHIVISQSRWCW